MIRAERENCCDDTVVALTDDPRGLAVALTLLEEHRWARSRAALVATGGSLSERVRRLLGASPPSVACGPAVGVVLVVAGMALAAGQSKTPLRPRTGTDVMIEFVDTSRNGNYRMTRDPAGR